MHKALHLCSKLCTACSAVGAPVARGINGSPSPPVATVPTALPVPTVDAARNATSPESLVSPSPSPAASTVAEGSTVQSPQPSPALPDACRVTCFDGKSYEVSRNLITVLLQLSSVNGHVQPASLNPTGLMSDGLAASHVSDSSPLTISAKALTLIQPWRQTRCTRQGLRISNAQSRGYGVLCTKISLRAAHHVQHALR